MKQKEAVRRLISVANDYKTLYVNGTWGWPMTKANKERACRKNKYNIEHKAQIYAASADTFGFDCSGLIKGVTAWGWDGNPNKQYGGAGYAINGVPDINEVGIAEACTEKSSDFSKIKPAMAVWMDGHIGVYVGDGHVVEATADWESKVVISDIGPNGERSRNGVRGRPWAQYGKMPWIEYEGDENKVNVTYKVNANGWLPEVKNKEDYAGIFGKPISAVMARISKGDIFYRVHVKGGAWLPEVKNNEDYAGIIGKPIDAIMARGSGATVHVQSHVVGGGWLGDVTGYDENDAENGYSGIFGKEIDGIYMWADPVFPENPPQDEPKPSDPADDTPPSENPVQSEKTPVPAWFYDLVEEFYNKFREKYEKLGDNSEKGEEK